MKVNLLTLVILIAFTSLTFADEPDWYQAYQTSWPVYTSLTYANGLYYSNNQYYNATNNSVVSVQYQANCTSPSTFNTNFTLWCVAKSPGSQNYSFSLNKMSIYLNQSVKSYNIPGTYSNTPFAYWFYSYQYIIVVLYDLEPYVYNISVFDTETESFVCTDVKLPNVLDIIQSVWFTGKELIAIFLDEQKNSDFLNIKCSTSRVVRTKGPSELQQLEFYGFNNSGVFLNYYIYEINGATWNEIQICDLNTLGTMTFGSKLNITSFAQLNDTHLMVGHLQDGEFKIDIYIITPELNFLRVFSYVPNIRAYELYIYPLIGTTQVTIMVKSGSLVFDYQLNKIIAANSVTSPLFLGNGSIVNVTQYGYIIQSPGEDFYYINVPFGSTYQDPANPGLFYSFYFPIYQTNLYNDCVFISIDTANSNITKIDLPNCPGSTLTIPTIKDVSYDSNGIPNILYRDALNTVYIVTPHSARGPFKNTALLTFTSISQNLTTGTGYYVGVQVTQSMLTSGIFNLTNGQLISLRNFQGGNFNFVNKMNSRYYMIAEAVSNASSRFVIWDAWNQVEYSTINSNFKMTIQVLVPFQVMGTYPEGPSFSGILYNQFPYSVFLIGYDGNYSMVTLDGTHSFLDAQIVDDSSFFTYAVHSNMYQQSYVKVKFWDDGRKSNIVEF